MFTIQLHDSTTAVAAATKIPAGTVLVTVPVSVPVMNSWQDFLTWLRNNPEIISMIIMAILALLGAATTPPQTPQK